MEKVEKILIVCLLLLLISIVILSCSIAEKINQTEEKVVPQTKIIPLKVVFTYSNGNWTNATIYAGKIKNSS